MSAFIKEGWKKNGLEEEAWTGEMAEAVLAACDMPSRGRDF